MTDVRENDNESLAHVNVCIDVHYCVIVGIRGKISIYENNFHKYLGAQERLKKYPRN